MALQHLILPFMPLFGQVMCVSWNIGVSRIYCQLLFEWGVKHLSHAISRLDIIRGLRIGATYHCIYETFFIILSSLEGKGEVFQGRYQDQFSKKGLTFLRQMLIELLVMEKMNADGLLSINIFLVHFNHHYTKFPFRCYFLKLFY